MRSLQLNDIAYNLGVRVYCNGCRAWYDPRFESGKVRKNKCSHPPKQQRYKSTIHVPIAGGKRRRPSITYETRNLKEVILEGLEYKNNVKSDGVEKAANKKPEKPTLLIDCLAMFLDFKNDIGVEEYEKKDLSTGALGEFKNHIRKWKKATELAKEDFMKIRVDNVSKNNVSTTIKYLSKWSNDTQRRTFGFYNEFYRYLNKNGYDVNAPFGGIQVSSSKESDARAVTYKEYLKVRTAIENGTSDDKLRGRKIHFDWLIEALDFRALTGRRREDFLTAKFSDIRLIDDELLGGYIRVLDWKYSRQNSHKIGFRPKYTKAPIFPEMRDFLLKMGYEKYKGTDRFIVAGDEKKKRITLANNLTNAFGFYRNKTGMDKEIRMNGLRDGYVTRMRNEFGDNANFFTGHASSRVDKIHYYDDKELFEKMKGFKLWNR